MRYLMILEVSQKQAYIFSSRRLRENLIRSEEIRYVTSPEFFAVCCPELYSDAENMVYSGGGHTILQFDDRARAVAFSRAVTERVLRQFPEMELFVHIMEYGSGTPGENLNRLTAELEAKKALRKTSVRRLSFGVEKSVISQDKFDPIPIKKPVLPAGWCATDNNDELAGPDNFLAVVHIDGNSMGKRVQGLYSASAEEWDACKEKLKTFSDAIDNDFRAAFDEMTRELTEALPKLQWPTTNFPVRKIIGAGDDVCFVTAGCLGLECAVSFLTHLSKKQNAVDGKPYAACAGVVLVHKHYPFRAAYDLSEALCSSAKTFGAVYDSEGGISAIDWHIEFGQLKDSLSAIRADYRTDDGAQLELRPLLVTQSRPGEKPVPIERRYSFFTALLRQLKENEEKLPRSKVKQLRDAFRQGELESRLAMRQTQTEDILWLGLEQRSPDWLERTLRGDAPKRGAFITEEEGGKITRRCLFFDAIEMMDHITLWREDEA